MYLGRTGQASQAGPREEGLEAGSGFRRGGAWDQTEGSHTQAGVAWSESPHGTEGKNIGLSSHCSEKKRRECCLKLAANIRKWSQTFITGLKGYYFCSLLSNRFKNTICTIERERERKQM